MPVQPAGPNEALLVRLRLILCQRNAVECAINIYMWFWIPKARASSTVSVSQGRDIFRLVQALVRVRVEVVLFLGSVRNRLPPGRFAHAAGVRRHDGRREVGPAQRPVPVLVDELDDTPPVQQHRLPKPQVPACARKNRTCVFPSAVRLLQATVQSESHTVPTCDGLLRPWPCCRRRWV